MSTVIRPLHTAVSSPLRIDARRPRTAQRGLVGVALVALLIVMALGVPAAPAYAAGTITVNTTIDEYGAGANCSLREAVQSANNNANFGGCALSGTQPFTINLGAGTFQLTIAGANEDVNATGDLDIRASGTIIAGAGAASTTIQQTTADRVIDINPTVAASFSAGISNLRITGGNASGTFGGGGIIYGDSNGGGTLTLNGVTVDGNTATQGPGGGIDRASRGNLDIIEQHHRQQYGQFDWQRPAGRRASTFWHRAPTAHYHQLDDLGQPRSVHRRCRRRTACQYHRRHGHDPAHPLR